VPVLKTGADDGYYVVTRHDDVRSVLVIDRAGSTGHTALKDLPSASRVTNLSGQNNELVRCGWPGRNAAGTR
jgi:hypothetical protein